MIKKNDVYSFGVVLCFIFTCSLLKQKLSDKLSGKKLQNKTHIEANDSIIEKIDWYLPVDIIIRIITYNFRIGNILGFIYAATKWKMCPFL